MNGTKWATLIVLALFLGSIMPFVAADEGRDEGTAEDVPEATLYTEESNEGKRFESAREEMKIRAEAKRAELQTKRTAMQEKNEAKRSALRARFEAAKEARTMKRETFQQFKEQRQQIKQDREAARTQLGEVRDTLRDCGAQDTPECEAARGKARDASRTFLTKAAEHIIAVLERTRERVEASDLSAEAKAELIADIDAKLAEVAAAQESVSSLGADATKQDLKDAAQIIRDVWNDSKKSIKKGVSKAASHRIGGVIQKMDHLDDKFDRVITQLKKQGKDTSSAEAKTAEFEAKLEAAEKLHAEALALFESGDHPAAAEKIRAAHAELKAAHLMLKGIVQEIRGIGGSKDLENESTHADEDDADEAEGEHDAGEQAESEDGAEDESAEDESEDADEDHTAGNESTEEQLRKPGKVYMQNSTTEVNV